MKNAFLLLCFFLTCLSCETSKDTSSPNYDIDFSWELLGNNWKGKSEFKSIFTFENNGKEAISGDWFVYFSMLEGRLYKVEAPSNVSIRHLSGDFYRLDLSSITLKKGQKLKVEVLGKGHCIKTSGSPKGPYFTVKNLPFIFSNFTLSPFTKEAQINRGSNDRFPIPTPAFRYQQNEKITSVDNFPMIVPTPLSFVLQGDSLKLTPSFPIFYDVTLTQEANYLKEKLTQNFNQAFTLKAGLPKNEKGIYLQLKPLKGIKSRAGYSLVINSNGVEINANSAVGVFYGIQSFRALLPFEKTTVANLPQVIIKDEPRFPYRGMHLDVARNFHKKDIILKLLDAMAFYKLNKFHFHLTDDEGWRLEIPDLPELTSVGATRGHTVTERERLQPAYGSGHSSNNKGTGFYTRSDFVEILTYAKARHIEVIPEIDLPGHSRAAIKAMEARYFNLIEKGDTAAAEAYLLTDFKDTSKYRSVQHYDDNVICPCQPSTYRFIEKVTASIHAMYQAAGVPFEKLHIGGDEVPKGVWQGSPKCQALIKADKSLQKIEDLPPYFLKKVDQILGKYNLVTAGWEEIALVKKDGKYQPNPRFIHSNFLPYVWNSIYGWGGEDLAYQLANAGYPVIMCNASNLYFDCSYDKDPNEPGLYWAGFVNTRSPYEFEPYDLFKSARLSSYGKPLYAEKLSDGKVTLSKNKMKNILGIQGQLWSETLVSDSLVEHYLFPKLIGLSERAWATRASWSLIENQEQRFKTLDANWNIFANTIGKREFKRLDFWNIHYRIAPPGAIIKKGKVFANTAYPDLIIRYTTDGSLPNVTSSIYTSPFEIKTAETIRLAAFSSNGRKSNIVTLENK